MSYHTTQKQFTFLETKQYASIIPDTGATVTVEFANGNGWVEDPESPISGPAKIFAQSNTVRLTPSGGGYHVDEGAAL